ncbi:aldehyde ferredoxin oxidoreductase C-terminal domain-containing protein [Desulfocicer niacini]
MLNTLDLKMIHEGNAHAAGNIMDRTYTKDCLLPCDSCWPVMFFWNTPDHVGDPPLESRTFSAVTSIKMDEKTLNNYGERIFNLERAILIREGSPPSSTTTWQNIIITSRFRRFP